MSGAGPTFGGAALLDTWKAKCPALEASIPLDAAWEKMGMLTRARLVIKEMEVGSRDNSD